MKQLIDQLARERDLPDEALLSLIRCETPETEEYLAQTAAAVRQNHYGKDVYIRGLIEFTNYCKNDCLYCGIRRSNKKAQRYRLSEEDILECCRHGYELGFRTFVLQGGEDPYFTRERMVRIVSSIKQKFPDCALTLSVGEKSREEYEAYFTAGADRYLLRHETACPCHYAKLHPAELTLAERMRCISDLKEIGFQTGIGFMVGSPFQTPQNILQDLRYIQSLRPEMVGIGPFIPHKDTPFCDEPAGTARQTLRLLAIIRLMLPTVLLPATTALGTIDGDGRIKGMNAGCNVVMPNLSPKDYRAKYLLYDNKIATGDEAAESLASLKKHMHAAGYEVVTDRGDYKEN